MSEPKPCPACRKQAESRYFAHGAGCFNDGCFLKGYVFPIADWNTRAPSPALDRLKELVNELRHDTDCDERDCTCFKSRALRIIEEELGKNEEGSNLAPPRTRTPENTEE